MSLEFILIDDDATFRQVMARSLSRMEYKVEAFEHPEVASESIYKAKAPYVILDLKLEGDSGLRYVKSIKLANANCRIILLTGYASISTAVEAIKLGADDYLTKPITARELIAHIESPVEGEETPIEDKPMSIDRLEWEHIHKVLSEYGGNISATARALGMHRRTLQRKLAKRPKQS
ncbi:response regulator transcription factor [Aliikangiella sp. G2MR2-5]|uniref:response regulator transcription factor n=1 Tax=Aliikangiella sp. G2MR2-5 TaxID=2788943 RepID=UPI0018AA785B|nr:response regulator [Aliikangiella sp. G2MR2-5]